MSALERFHCSIDSTVLPLAMLVYNYAVLISHAPESNEGSATIHNVIEMNGS